MSKHLPPQARLATQRYDDDVHRVLEYLRHRRMPDQPIVFYGSSSFRLWASMAEDLDCLEVINLGFGGGTNASGVYYADKLLILIRPSKVVLYFGENDISNDGLDSWSTFEDFKKLRHHISEKLGDVPVYVLSAKQSPNKWPYADDVEKYNRLLEQYCRSDRLSWFINVASVLTGENGKPAGCYFQIDHVHLNAAGYRAWARILKAELQLGAE